MALDVASMVPSMIIAKLSQEFQVEPEELEAIATEGKRTIEIDEFVPKRKIDEFHLRDSYYFVPDAIRGDPRGDQAPGHGRKVVFTTPIDWLRTIVGIRGDWFAAR
jgi:hypothetical protein